METAATGAILTADMFSGFTAVLTENLAIVIPAALGIFATVWGIRLAISMFKSTSGGSR